MIQDTEIDDLGKILTTLAPYSGPDRARILHYAWSWATDPKTHPKANAEPPAAPTQETKEI